MAITWRQLAAPQLQTNFQDNSLKGFSDLFSGLAQQNQFAKEKEKADITENLKSSFFNYTGQDGAESLNTLVSSGKFGEMMASLGDKVDQDAVRQALLGTQARLTQNNERDRLQAERDRLLAQKPYVDAIDLLISQNKLDEAEAYATGLNQDVLDNDLSAKVFSALRDAKASFTDTSNRQAIAKITLDKAQRTEQNDVLVNKLMSEWERVAKPETPSTEFYGIDSPQYAAEANKRLNAINSVISQTFKIPLVDGVLDTSELTGSALDTFNKMYQDQVANLQVPKPGSTLSDRTQAFRQAALAQNIPVDVVSQFDKTLQERMKLESPSPLGQDVDTIKREQQKLTTLKAQAEAVDEEVKRKLSEYGLSGNTLADISGQDAIIEKLKKLGITPNAKDGDVQDQYSYIMAAIADPKFASVDSKVVANIIDKVVAKRSGSLFSLDVGYRGDIMDEIFKYMRTKEFVQNTNAILEAKEKAAKVNNAYFNARMSAAQPKTK